MPAGRHDQTLCMACHAKQLHHRPMHLSHAQLGPYSETTASLMHAQVSHLVGPLIGPRHNTPTKRVLLPLPNILGDVGRPQLSSGGGRAQLSSGGGRAQLCGDDGGLAMLRSRR
jgi:hypothetical protein